MREITNKSKFHFICEVIVMSINYHTNLVNIYKHIFDLEEFRHLYNFFYNQDNDAPYYGAEEFIADIGIDKFNEIYNEFTNSKDFMRIYQGYLDFCNDEVNNDHPPINELQFQIDQILFNLLI